MFQLEIPSVDKICTFPGSVPRKWYKASSLWVRVCSSHYLVGFRRIPELDPDQSRAGRYLHLIRWTPEYAKIGKTVWVCFDMSNGGPFFHLGRIYLWAYSRRDQAQKKYQTHKSHFGKKDSWKFATLAPPIKYLAIDEITLED